MSRVVVDASVVVKWFVPEVHAEAAAAILGGPYDLCFPDLLYPEVGNVLWNKLRRGEVDETEAAAIVTTLSRLAVEVFASGPILPAALELALATGSTVYDCTYVCLAASVRAPLVTADRRLVSTQSRGPLGRWVRFVDDPPDAERRRR